MAKHIYENAGELHKLAWFGGGIFAWTLVVSIEFGYKYLQGKHGGARDIETRPLQEVRQF